MKFFRRLLQRITGSSSARSPATLPPFGRDPFADSHLPVVAPAAYARALQESRVLEDEQTRDCVEFDPSTGTATITSYERGREVSVRIAFLLAAAAAWELARPTLADTSAPKPQPKSAKNTARDHSGKGCL